MQIDPCLSLGTKLKSKWITACNIKPDTQNQKEQNVKNPLELIGTGNNFLNRTPTAQVLRSTIKKWDLMKLKSFCSTKDSVHRTK